MSIEFQKKKHEEDRWKHCLVKAILELQKKLGNITQHDQLASKADLLWQLEKKKVIGEELYIGLK